MSRDQNVGQAVWKGTLRDAVRLRTGMYIGRLGDGSNPADGIYVMLKEVIDNSVDEFIMGQGRKIEVERVNDQVRVRDFGRGIPLGKVIDCVSQINTGGKYNDDVFQYSVGLNGVGTKAVNALSSRFQVTSWREGKFGCACGHASPRARGADTAARDDRIQRRGFGRAPSMSHDHAAPA